jgi:hypothetical protein
MSASKRKTTTTVRKRKMKVTEDVDRYQPGMPARDSITSVETVQKGGKPFHIIHTTEVDEYEQPPPHIPRKKKASKK